MNVKRNRILFLLVSICLLAAGAARAGEKDVLDHSIDFKVTDADSGEVLKTFGQILSAQVTFDPELAGRKVTFSLEKVRLRTVLGAVCDTLGCEWDYVPGKPAKLTFRAGAVPAASKAPEGEEERGLDDEIDIHLTAANVVEVLRTAGHILSVEVSLDPKVTGTVDFAEKAIPVREVLNRVCAKVGCNWKLVRGEKSVLQVTSTK